MGNLVDAHIELGKTAETALAAGDPKYAATAEAAASEQGELEKRLAILKIEVENAPADAQLIAGGREIPKEQWGLQLPFASGNIDIVLRGGGKELAKRTVDTLAGDIGSRPAGSEAQQRATEFLRSSFQGLGYEVTVQEFPVRMFVDRGSSLRLAGDHPEELSVNSVAYSASGDVEQEVADGGIGRPEELGERGFVVLSAGVGAYEGMPAAREAVEVIQDRGGSLRRHSSRRITPELMDQADLIVAMTRGHRDTLLAYFPEAAGRLRLLDPAGGDVIDPIGEAYEVYLRTAREIETHLAHLVRELGV